MFDEEFIQKPNTKPIDLELLSVSELEERIIALREEICVVKVQFLKRNLH